MAFIGTGPILDKGGSIPPTPRYIPSYANVNAPTYQTVTRENARAVEQGIIPKPTRTTTTNNVAPTRTAVDQPVSTQPEFSNPATVFTPAEPLAPEATPYNVYDDPFYQQALAGAQSQFNLARADALANTQYQERPLQRELEMRPDIAQESRRRLAGNYAARGMGGGRYGALTRAEAQMNAREIANRTGLREQIAELGRQFTSKFGAEGTDWLGTRAGYEAQQAAIQQALQNRLGGLTTV